MSESGKVTPSHLSRVAVVYVRQSTLGQVERNSESTARQYDLAARAQALGWPAAAVRVIDADLGISGSVTGQREGFENLVAEIALGQVGIVLALEASRLARDNSAWYRLLDLAGACDTLVGDGDGIYHPGLFNDRLLLGMKGIMSEAELHVLRARLDGGIRNKAARGELRRGLPVGLVWGEADGEILVHPDEAVTGVIAAVFERFAECGSVRGVWLWLRDQGLRWPLQSAGYVRGGGPADITWVEPTYHAVHTTLTHPAYAGAYVYGRTRVERYVDDDGALRTRRRKVPQDQWEVLIPDHHDGFLDWDTYQANQARIGSNIRPEAHEPGAGAVREGCALLQGLATCGTCARKLAVYYQGPNKATPGYYCTGTGTLVEGRGVRHLRVGGAAIDAAVAEAFLVALAPTALQACLAAAQQLEDGHDAVLAQWRRQVEQARYAATQAERRYRAVDPDNRLVARGLERDWEHALTELAFGCGQLGQGVFPVAFQAAGDEPVVGVHGAVTTFRLGRGVASLLDLSAPLGQDGVVAVLELLGGGQAGLQRGGGQRDEERLGDGGVDRGAAHAQMADTPALDERAGAGAVVAGCGLVGALVVDGELAGAGPAGGQALQQRAAFPHGPGAGLVRLGTDVGTDAGLVGLVGVPVEEPVVVVGDEDLPLILGDLATPGTQRPVVVDVALHAGASVDVGAGIGGMGQGGVDRVVGRLHPGDVRWPAAAHVTGGLQRPAQPLVAQPQPHAAHRAALGEAFEDRGDHTRDGLVGMHKDLAVGLAPHQPDRQAAAQLTAGGLVADAAVETGAQHVQFRLAHDALHPQQEAVVEQPRVVDAVTVADQRVTRSG